MKRAATAETKVSMPLPSGDSPKPTCQTRLAVDLLRVEESRERLAAAIEERLVDGDHELTHVRVAYRGAFRQAFADSLAELDREHRSLLRLHYGEGMTTAALAGLNKVSRATIIRRVADGREASIEAMAAKLDGMIRMLRSQLDVSVGGLRRTSLG